MDTLQAMQERRSIRVYTDRKIEGEVLGALTQIIEACNEESGLNIQLCIDEPTAFGGFMSGRLKNVRNYICLVGKQQPDLDERCGYYGEQIVIKAQQLGLRTCWVGVSYSKGKSKKEIHLNADEKLVLVIAVGYGAEAGVEHKSKPLESLCEADGEMPEWFVKGVKTAQNAPTAINQQKFKFILNGQRVKAVSLGGFYSKVDLGIAKYHFEVGAGRDGWEWA